MTTPTEMAAQVAARRERYAQLRQITAEQAGNIAALARENPSLSPGVLYAAGRGGVQPGTPAAQRLSQADLQVKAEKGNIFQRAISAGYKTVKVVGGAALPDIVGDTVSGVAPVLKGVSRGATMGPLAVPQAFQGLIRSGRSDDGNFGVSDLFDPSDWRSAIGQTDLAAGHRQIQQSGGYAGLVTGSTDVDFGSGFFVGGEVARDAGAFKQASTDERIGGKLPTYGRLLANEVGLEPGNTAYNIVSGLADMTVELGFDPLSYSSAVTKPLQARRLFAGDASKGFDAAGTAARVEDSLVDAAKARPGVNVEGLDRETLLAQMGAVDGIRKTVESDRVLEWLTASRQGQDLVAVLSKETDFGKLYDATKGKIDPQTLLALTQREMTGDEVIAILGPKLGRTARTDQKFGVDAVAKADAGLAGGVSGLGTLATATFKRKARDVRVFGTVPERVLPKNDLDETLENASAFMRNAFISGPERSEILRRFAEVNGGEGMYDVTREMMALGARQATERFGIPRERATELFKIYENAEAGRRKFWMEQVVHNGEKAWVKRAFNVTDEYLDDGTVRDLPHLASQFLDSNIPLPDPRAIRAEMSRFRHVLANPAIKVPTSALQQISDNIFKPLVLLRPAYITRNQIDEQFRPAGAGLNSMMSHPVQYLHWLMSDQAGVGRVLAKGGFTARGQVDASGAFFDENAANIRATKEAWQNAKRSGDVRAVEEARAAYEAAKGAIQSITPFTDEVSEFARAQTGGLGNWRNRAYSSYNGDDLYQKASPTYARAMGEGLHRIFNDPVAKRIARGDDLEEVKAAFWQGPLQKFRTDLSRQGERMAYLEDELGAAQYIEDTAAYIKSFTGDSVDLRQAAATGRIGDVPLTRGDTLEVTPQALERLDILKNTEGFQGPDAVIGSTLLKGGGEQTSRYSAAVDWMFYQLNDRPVRYLSKSPAFRQRYYQRLENLIGFVDDATADRIIAGAKDANLKAKDIKRLTSKRRPGGSMTFEEADLVAKADALEFVRDLFYDLHHRGQFFDVTRLMFPFGEVFLDSAKKYSQLTANNPVLPYRLGQVIQGSRDADTDGDGQGFFYTDEQTGEEMFAFPGSETLLAALGQQGAGQLRAPVQNLNILGTTVVPGFGPAVQIAAAAMLPDEADFNAVQEFFSPYGERTLQGGALESFFPSWFQKALVGMGVDQLTTPKQQRQFVQAKKDWMGYLASTGQYNLQESADIQRLTDDAHVKARTTFFIRGLAQSIAPSPPSPEFVAYDKGGKLQTQFRLAEEYRRIQKEQEEAGTPEATDRIFIETFGEQAVLAVIPNTKAADDRSPIPPNREALEFWQANKGAASRFPTVFGMFAPDPEGAEFDWVAYNRQIENGERVVVTPEEAVKRANQKVARMIYDNAKQAAGDKPTKEQKEALSTLKGMLAEDFPGYSASFSNDTPALIEDLKRAAKDPQLGSTPAGQGLAIWLQARDAAEAGAQARFGVGWRQSDKARPIRDAMRALADELAADFPGFSNIYERALEREMARDT